MVSHYKKGNDSSYQKLVREISSHVPEQQRNAVQHVLETHEAKNTYRILHQYLPENLVPPLMISGIEDFAQGRNLSPHRYVSVVAEELKQLGHYDNVIGEMHHRHMLNDREYTRIMATLKGHTDKSIKGLKGLEALVRRAAVFISLLSGVVLILTVQPTITGAVVGILPTEIFRPLIGFVLLIFSLYLIKGN